MDGLLVDSEPLWTIAEQELATELGGVWSDALKASIVGTRLDVAVPTILRHYGRLATEQEVTWASRWLLSRMVELFEAGPVLMPGAAPLLQELRMMQVPVALVSSSYRVLVDAVLRSGLGGLAGLGPFDLTLAGDEVVHGKPHPEPYLTAAARLGVDPADCVVLEDSAAGVAAGEAAGCCVVAVPSVPGVSFQPAPGRLVVPSLAGMTVSDLLALVLRPTG
jgi:beta-phosphoglucomutase-like phosphatase (HAD superfamily)